jgi:hypothetical protein
MTGEGQEGGGLHRVNFPGLIAGIALVILPFLGAWWVFSFGTDAVVIALSPFHVQVESFGNEISSPLLASLNVALKVVMIYYGVLLIAGSVLRAQESRRSISDILVRVSARKFLWLVLLFVLSVAVTDFIIGQAFTFMGVPAQVPYFVGNTQVSFQAGPVSMTVPLIQGFTLIFAVAVAVAIISLIAYYYQEHVVLVKTTQGTRFGRVPEESQAAAGGEQAPVETGKPGQ